MCLRVGFAVEVYPTVRRWPFFGEVRAGRCFRTDRCGAHVLAVDVSPDLMFTGPELMTLQYQQGCRCMDVGYSELAKLAFLTGSEATKLMQLGVAVFPPSGPGVQVQVEQWLQKSFVRPAWNAPQAHTEGQAGTLFMRCPDTGKILPADSLKVLQEHFASIGQLLAPRQVLRIRDANWCDADGTAIAKPDGALEQWRRGV